MLRKRYQLNWMFECPDAVLTISILRCKELKFYIIGCQDKTLYLINEEINIIDDRVFDGWCRCSYPIDLDGDGCDEVLVGAGDGNFMVLKLNAEKNKLVGLMRYKASMRINCCTAGDFTRDGNIELIFGSEDKTLKIFNDIKSKEPEYVLYYDSWVTACSLGFLKLPDEEVSIFTLLVGTKNGLIQLIQFGDKLPDILWQRNFNTQINDIEVGDVTNDGLNEIILSTDDATIKILNSEGEIITEIETEEGRPLSLLIEDIDGDNAKEIVAGCADGHLKVFHNPALNSNDFELKWKIKVSTSIKDVCFILSKEQNLKNIVFGGYDRTIRNVTDFEYGQKQALDIPQQIKIPKIKTGKEEELHEELAKAEPVPTNIRENIFSILQKKGVMKGLTRELTDLGYNQQEILDELEVLRTQKSVIYEKVTYPVWGAPGEEVPKEIPERVKVEIKTEEKAKVVVQPMVIEETVKSDKEKLVATLTHETTEAVTIEKNSAGGSLNDVLIEYLTQKKVVSSKSLFINDIKEKGFAQNEVEKEINRLKEKGIIKYSRSKPKGWILS